MNVHVVVMSWRFSDEERVLAIYERLEDALERCRIENLRSGLIRVNDTYEVRSYPVIPGK